MKKANKVLCKCCSKVMVEIDEDGGYAEHESAHGCDHSTYTGHIPVTWPVNNDEGCDESLLPLNQQPDGVWY